VSEALNDEANPTFTGVISSVVALVLDTDGRVLLASSSESGRGLAWVVA
jgi:hypothetical protein